MMRISRINKLLLTILLLLGCPLIYSQPIKPYDDYVSTESIVNEKRININLSESGYDSIIVYFPYIATSTTIFLFKDKKRKKFDKALHVSYINGNEDNFIIFKRKDIGKYYGRMTSCHSREKFTLVIK